MDVPKVPTDVAWYTGGARPGQIGNVAIDGHYDTDTGAAAVFYTLKDIHVGDLVQIIDDQNHLYVYSVTKVDSYTNDDFPFTEIFGKSDQAHLYLITCDGIWNRQEHNYSKRAVVTAQLQY
jgi:LPXTG-site transpeptidase (sortase) family protein